MEEPKKTEGQNKEPAPKSPWQFSADTPPGGSSSSAPVQASTKPVKWTASEFIEHNKSADWYLTLGIGGAVLAAGIYLLTQDVISVVMVIIVAVIFGIFAARKPRVLEYQVDELGMHIGAKFYPYSSFKSFAVVSEDSINSIWLLPLKRFMPILTIYFAPDDNQKIIDTLGKYLPIQNHEPDFVDRLMHKLRF